MVSLSIMFRFCGGSLIRRDEDVERARAGSVRMVDQIGKSDHDCNLI
jgi:hypothetical protein